MDITSSGLGAGDMVYVTASKEGVGSGADYGTINDHGFAEIAVIIVRIAIPEFATIAVPVAAILGLLFFFNRRKQIKK